MQTGTIVTTGSAVKAKLQDSYGRSYGLHLSRLYQADGKTPVAKIDRSLIGRRVRFDPQIVADAELRACDGIASVTKCVLLD